MARLAAVKFRQTPPQMSVCNVHVTTTSEKKNAHPGKQYDKSITILLHEIHKR